MRVGVLVIGVPMFPEFFRLMYIPTLGGCWIGIDNGVLGNAIEACFPSWSLLESFSGARCIEYLET
jgi:hypothetical protein